MEPDPTGMPNIRLLAAAVVTLVLLVWVTVFDDSWQIFLMFVPPAHRLIDPDPILVTAGISLLNIILLFPVIRRAPRGNRWQCVALAIFPLCMFVIAVLLLI